MSGPMPSPSMYGMIGWSGTVRRPPERVMALPFGGIFGEGLAMWAPLGRAKIAPAAAPVQAITCDAAPRESFPVELPRRNTQAPLPRRAAVTMLSTRQPRRAPHHAARTAMPEVRGGLLARRRRRAERPRAPVSGVRDARAGRAGGGGGGLPRGDVRGAGPAAAQVHRLGGGEQRGHAPALRRGAGGDPQGRAPRRGGQRGRRGRRGRGRGARRARVSTSLFAAARYLFLQGGGDGGAKDVVRGAGARRLRSRGGVQPAAACLAGRAGGARRGRAGAGAGRADGA